MKRKQQPPVVAVLFPGRDHTCRQCLDVPRVVVVTGDDAQIRRASLGRQRFEYRVVGGTRGGGGVLGIERQPQHAARAPIGQVSEGGGDTRFAVAHTEGHFDLPAPALAQLMLQGVRLTRRVDQQRRAVLGPDLPISGRRIYLRTGVLFQVDFFCLFLPAEQAEIGNTCALTKN